MDFKEILKFVLLGVAGWWVYNDFIAPADAAPVGESPAPPPSVPDVPGAESVKPPPPPGAEDQTQPPPAPADAPPPPTQEQVIKAAADPAYGATFRPDFRLTQHQWNWYREKGGKTISTADLSTDPNNYAMNAADYHSRRATLGLNGGAGGPSRQRGVGRYTVN